MPYFSCRSMLYRIRVGMYNKPLAWICRVGLFHAKLKFTRSGMPAVFLRMVYSKYSGVLGVPSCTPY